MKTAELGVFLEWILSCTWMKAPACNMGRYHVHFTCHWSVPYNTFHSIYCPVRNKMTVPSVTLRTGHFLTSFISLIFFLCIKWGSHVLRRKIINIMLMKILVCELLKLFVPKHHRWEKYDFWTYFLQRSHWHTWTDLWYTYTQCIDHIPRVIFQ